MLELLSTPEIWLSLATLTFLEIVLGVDNVIFVALMAARLPEARRASARTLGLAMALLFRIIMLMGLVWMAHLEADLFAVFDHGVSWRDLILLGGGLFLLAKGTLEIHHTVEGVSEAPRNAAGDAFLMIVAQITVIDIVFSLDSVITAVGMTDHVPIMITAVVIAMGVMLFAAGTVARFIENHPTTKMLALAFLLLIGMSLIADGLGFHIPRGYLYFAIAFSLFVEVLNILAKKARSAGSPPSGKDVAG
ncbi:TerC family protein [Maricaulis salignorans]|uniref:Membrane protein TerC, possibly involved in tellurium resistance n=1 Tax=Maricaulis salignorans TaxID=144026 RepID=A0A1G9LL69_9PROT|nr:TerC family protein [Maricaulis salignorans]SDL62618.1 Membrane protein TerC, possibly involved in tellurium resistance [Maricaulis salignorans]